MTVLRPFQAVRPSGELANSIAALPYDVYNRQEAREVVARNPLSFLKIDRAETQFSADTDMYSQQVYDCARETLEQMIADQSFVKEDSACYYIYALTFHECTQTGLVGCASIDDYLQNRIKKHENTRQDKELDRIRHVDTLSAQTGPIFLAYPKNKALSDLFTSAKKQPALYDFTGDDSVRHQVWKINNAEDMNLIARTFESIDSIYIADGHHRAASAVKVGLKRRNEQADYNRDAEFNYVLSVLFPAEELHIYDYNRVIFDLNGYTFDTFLDKVRSCFEVSEMGATPFAPSAKRELGLYGKGKWYCLKALPFLCSDDPVDGLDVSVLQNVILGPLLGIKDPKTDSRIQFVGGIRGLNALSEIADQHPDGIAFSVFPPSMNELLAVADAGRLMPPKSTWFEPKLRSGLLIHQFESNSPDYK